MRTAHGLLQVMKTGEKVDDQLQRNFVALVRLFVAVSSVGCNTTRNVILDMLRQLD
jgi:hypothetical protein